MLLCELSEVGALMSASAEACCQLTSCSMVGIWFFWVLSGVWSLGQNPESDALSRSPLEEGTELLCLLTGRMWHVSE